MKTNLELIEIVLLGLFAFGLIVQLFYYFYFYIRLAVYKSKQCNENQYPPVSVIIAARNEEENLQQFLPILMTQDYPKFEVIVVNDCSFDDTANILSDFKSQYKNLHVTHIEDNGKFTQGKKLALTIGIKAAQYEHLVFTDADCMPIDEAWLKSITATFTPKTEIVLGYGKYKHESGLLNNFIRFDTFFIALQYMSFALARKPYMGVGRNLSYLKSLFFENKGFASHLKIASGDDDLFVNAAANKENTEIVINPESFTESIPEKSFSKWINQKQRHLGSSELYKISTKWMLFFEPFSREVFYLSFIASLIFLPTELVYYVLGLFLVRLIVQISIFASVANKLKEKHLLLLAVIYDFIIPFINFTLLITNQFTTNKNRWR